jgi:hypothetical protein
MRLTLPAADGHPPALRSLGALGPFLGVTLASSVALILAGRAGQIAASPWTWVAALVPGVSFGSAGLIMQRQRKVPWTRIAALAVVAIATRGLLVSTVSWKIAIPSWRGFGADPALAAADRWLHGGVTPDRWLAPLLESAWFLPVMDWFYSVTWYAAFAGITLWAAWRLDGRHLLAVALVWVVLGGLMATLFASAGPCYYGPLGYGDLYAPLMDRLHGMKLTAITIQDTLWRGYLGEETGVIAGISAFPSIHVAMPALWVAALWRTRLRVPAIAYAALILLGSIALGWHYALDGYAGAIGALGCWWVAGRVLAGSGGRGRAGVDTDVLT